MLTHSQHVCPDMLTGQSQGTEGKCTNVKGLLQTKCGTGLCCVHDILVKASCSPGQIQGVGILTILMGKAAKIFCKEHGCREGNNCYHVLQFTVGDNKKNK